MRGTAEVDRGGELQVSTQRHSNGANSANGTRPKHGVLVGREYRLLAPEGPAGDPAAAGP